MSIRGSECGSGDSGAVRRTDESGQKRLKPHQMTRSSAFLGVLWLFCATKPTDPGIVALWWQAPDCHGYFAQRSQLVRELLHCGGRHRIGTRMPPKRLKPHQMTRSSAFLGVLWLFCATKPTDPGIVALWWQAPDSGTGIVALWWQAPHWAPHWTEGGTITPFRILHWEFPPLPP